jgi:hypothetical protein
VEPAEALASGARTPTATKKLWDRFLHQTKAIGEDAAAIEFGLEFGDVREVVRRVIVENEAVPMSGWGWQGFTYHVPPSMPQTEYKMIVERRRRDNVIGVRHRLFASSSSSRRSRLNPRRGPTRQAFCLPISVNTRVDLLNLYEYTRQDDGGRAVAAGVRLATIVGAQRHYWGVTKVPVRVRDVDEFSVDEQLLRSVDGSAAVTVPAAAPTASSR